MSKDFVTVQETKDYNKFKLLDANRDIVRGHVDRLKKAFEERGNLTAISPIVVNEHMEVIDGQNRLAAASELGEPVYYRQVSGLRIEDAQQMNILHKQWGVDDYAKTYAVSGNKQYIEYLKLREDYPFPHKVILMYTTPSAGRHEGIFAKFRTGQYEIADLETSRNYLTMLEQVWQLTPYKNSALAEAFLVCFKNEHYDQAHMLKKLIQYADRIMKPYTSKEDNLRQLEEVYNMHMQNRVRLY